ncbi:DinB family protein [Flavobacterium humi]|uniref:DinB family protein n=1 Tax=Flavobacterium humi TaxID=2562683 RepID=A0A4Z0L2U1_9FLAO|nr:DinB family protein [Flavobacterium humi]TGD56644.1 DinB family protein [Flavobacterium humi]
MQKSAISKMPEYFDRYINLTDDLSFTEVLQISLEELENLPVAQWKALGEEIYAPGKWTAKDILQHMIDTERVFSYRMTAFSRGDSQKMLAFDEDLYANNADANRRTIEDLLAELILVRKNYIALYASFSPEMLLKSGQGFNGSEYSVLAMAFMIPGHQRWHFNIVKERYFPLLAELKNQSS